MPDEVDDPMTDNGALNAIVVQLIAILNFLIGSYDDVNGAAIWTTVNDGNVMDRFADPLTIRTSVSNIGPDVAVVLEEGVIVVLVPPGESRELPGSGAGDVQIRAKAGESAGVAIASYRLTTP